MKFASESFGSCVHVAGRRIVAGAALVGLSAVAQATNYSEGAVVTGTYSDTTSHPGFTGTSGSCTYVNGVGTCTSYSEPNDLSSSAHVGQTISPTPTNSSPSDNGPTNIGSLTLGSNFITGASDPYGPIANTQTGELQYQDNDYVTFTVPTGYVLSNLYLSVGSSITPPDPKTGTPGDQAFIGLASGSNVYVSLPSSSGLLGYTLLSSSQIGSDILPAIGAANPAGFDSTAPMSPFAGATTFHAPLAAGTYTLWMLDGDRSFGYNLNLLVSQAPEPATWAMMIGGFGAIGASMRRRRAVASFA